MFGYVSGAYSFSTQVWPINVIIENRNAAIATSLSRNFNELGAFQNLTAKKEVPCPIQNASTAVILVIGQSNSANHAEKKYDSKFPNRVLNYYMGKCYSAQSPLLGASGLEGEYLTLMGDALIKEGSLRSIILVSKSIGDSTVSDWAGSGRFRSDLVSTVNVLNLKYRITDVIWHQGESDFTSNTSVGKYRESFQELKLVLNEVNVNAPIFMVISTICGFNSNWIAQKSLINNQDIFLGIDADSVLLSTDRRAQSPSQEPNCHLNEQGQIKVARLMSNRILESLHFQVTK